MIDLNGESFSTYEGDKSDFFSSVCQQHKTSMPEEGIIKFSANLMEEIKRKYTDFVLNEKDTLEQNEKLKFESELTRKTSQEISDIEKRIDRLEINISEKRGIENIQKAEIEDLKKRKEKLKTLNKESKLTVKSKLISLNYIYLYG